MSARKNTLACKKGIIYTAIRRFSQNVKRSNLEGLVVAPLTPFSKSGELDLKNIARCGQFFKKTKFDGLFVNGTLGEGLNMSNAERKKVAEKWKEVGDSTGLYVILHVGAGNLKDTQDLAKHAQDIGVDAIAALPTTYFKPSTEEQLISYLEKVTEVVPDLPLFYYEYNSTTGVYLNIPKMLEMAEDRIPSLCGLKHTTPCLSSALNCTNVCGGKYRIFYGAESLYLPALSLGIPDVITTPIMGDLFYNIKQAWDKKDLEAAQNYQNRAQQFSNILQQTGGGIAGYKTVFKHLSGIDTGYTRLPLTGISTDMEQTLVKNLKNNGFFSYYTTPCVSR